MRRLALAILLPPLAALVVPAAAADGQRAAPTGVLIASAVSSDPARHAPARLPKIVRLATMETSGFDQFDEINSGAAGTLAIDGSRAYQGSKSAHAITPASTGHTKFARGIWRVNWVGGRDVWYGAAFYLSSDFYARMQGEVDVLRWDNWSLEQRSQDQGGVTVLSDGRWVLVLRNLDQGSELHLTTPIRPLSTGAWHWIEVHQRLSRAGARALNELWIDGTRRASSRRPNWHGRTVTALRVGIVATNDSAQANPLELWFDRASISRGALRPRARR